MSRYAGRSARQRRFDRRPRMRESSGVTCCRDPDSVSLLRLVTTAHGDRVGRLRETPAAAAGR